MDLAILDEKIADVQWKVQSYSKKTAVGSFVAYIDARQAMDLLDKACGKGNWQDKYELVNGTLFCHLGIKIDGEWIWKTDCGTESNVEKEKGEVSDAFKRAAVKWGVGRFLYELPVQWVNSSEPKKDNTYPYPVDDNGKKIHDISKYINDKLRINEIRKDTKVTESEKTPAPLPLTTKNNDVVGQKKVKVPFDFKKFEEALDYLTTKERIEEEAQKAILENKLTESDLLGINSVKDKCIDKLSKKLAFFDKLKKLKVSEAYPEINGVLKYYPDYANRINTFIIPACQAIKVSNLDEAKALRAFFTLKNEKLQGNQDFENFFENTLFSKFKNKK